MDSIYTHIHEHKHTHKHALTLIALCIHNRLDYLPPPRTPYVYTRTVTIFVMAINCNVNLFLEEDIAELMREKNAIETLLQFESYCTQQNRTRDAQSVSCWQLLREAHSLDAQASCWRLQMVGGGVQPFTYGHTSTNIIYVYNCSPPHEEPSPPTPSHSSRNGLCIPNLVVRRSNSSKLLMLQFKSQARTLLQYCCNANPIAPNTNQPLMHKLLVGNCCGKHIQACAFEWLGGGTSYFTHTHEHAYNICA